MRKGWELKRLDELFDVKSSKRVHKADWKTEGIPFYRAREVVKLAQKGTVDNDLFISEELFLEFTKEKGAPKEGDIIISAVGTLGQCYLVKSEDKFYFKDASVLWFENISNVDTRYIEYAFKSDLIMKQVMHKSMGATVGTLTISRAKIIEIPIPSIQEQKQIVTILDKAFTAIDQAKANIEKNIINAKELFQSKLNDIFSQKGDGWEEKKLIEVNKFIDYRGKTPKKTDSGIKLITAKNVRMGYMRNEPEEFIAVEDYDDWMTRGIPKEGDVLFTTEAPLANVTLLNTSEKIALAQRIITLCPDRDILSGEYLTFCLQSKVIQDKILEKGTGATVTGIKSKLLKEIMIPIPSIKMQADIVKVMHQMRNDTDKIINIQINKLSSTQELKKSILQKAFAGELTQKEVAV
jgi:type I restriction enzyme S subunit